MDLIDRQAAIDIADDLRDCISVDGYWAWMERLKKLPSAQPERKKGRWTNAYDGYYDHVKCTGCFKTYDWTSQAQYYNFCPNCGADMREPEDIPMEYFESGGM